MKAVGAYGRTLARAMRVEKASSFVSHSMLRASQIAVTEIRSNSNDEQVTRPVPPEDGVLAMVQMAEWPKRLLFEDDRAIDAQPLSAGSAALFDLRKTWVGIRSTPVHYVCFYLPRSALAEVAELEGVGLPDEFPNDYRRGNEDTPLAGLARMLLPSFARPEEANSLFVDHVTAAACAHVLKRYGGAAAPARTSHKLSRTELAKSEDRLAAGLNSQVTVRELAADCGMSLTGFLRAFRFTTGMQPYAWLERHRMDLARSLAENTCLPIETIATCCGFCSGGHMRRALLKTSASLPPRLANASRRQQA